MSQFRTVTKADAPSKRTRVRRLPERGAYDREAVHAVLDAALVCHLGFVVDGQPYVIPTIHGRQDDTVYLHGSPASRMLRGIKRGLDVCLTATVVDGLVLARSAFHHSMNYRSVVVLGRATEVADLDAKAEALRVVSEHVLPGRWDEVRKPNLTELKGTTVLALPIEEASVKARSGPPGDEPEDYELPIWAGVLPLRVEPEPPVADPLLSPGIDVPSSVRMRSNGRHRRA
jgi:nitroimidazol reductase NimA-like FMN-containing flavoprotein (pyridoxamine 5'-phosphate oxidase superfamily)